MGTLGEEQQEGEKDSCGRGRIWQQMIDMHDAGVNIQAYGEGYQRRGEQETP